MRYEPKQIGKSAQSMCFATFVCAGIMVLASNVKGISGVGIMQSVAVLFLAAMIYIAVRFIFTTFRYEVVKRSKNDDSPIKSLAPEKLELRISRQQGKRGFICENIINLSDVISFEELPAGRGGRAMLKEAGKGPLFKYKRNMAGGKCWLLTAKGEKDNIRIVLEINPDGIELTDYIRTVALYNNEEK